MTTSSVSIFAPGVATLAGDVQEVNDAFVVIYTKKPRSSTMLFRHIPLNDVLYYKEGTAGELDGYVVYTGDRIEVDTLVGEVEAADGGFTVTDEEGGVTFVASNADVEIVAEDKGEAAPAKKGGKKAPAKAPAKAGKAAKEEPVEEAAAQPGKAILNMLAELDEDEQRTLAVAMELATKKEAGKLEGDDLTALFAESDKADVKAAIAETFAEEEAPAPKAKAGKDAKAGKSGKAAKSDDGDENW